MKTNKQNQAGKYVGICEYINLAPKMKDTMSAMGISEKGEYNADCRTMKEIFSPDTHFSFWS